MRKKHNLQIQKLFVSSNTAIPTVSFDAMETYSAPIETRQKVVIWGLPPSCNKVVLTSPHRLHLPWPSNGVHSKNCCLLLPYTKLQSNMLPHWVYICAFTSEVKYSSFYSLYLHLHIFLTMTTSLWKKIHVLESMPT